MRLIEPRYTVPPHSCCVTGRGDSEMIDFEVELSGPDQRVYMRPSAVEDAGKLIGMVPRSEVVKLERRIEALTNEIDKLRPIAQAIEKAGEAEAELQALTK